MPAKSLKAAEKQTILKKLTAEMKRRYGGSTPKQNRSTFETLIFAACLEDSSYPEAEAAYSRLLESFFDLNEIRVSSVTEIQESLNGINGADWKAMRIREALQHTFEKHYAFDLEPLRRKTQDVALKDLAQISHVTPFMRNYVVHHSLGAHVLPIDGTMNNVLGWLGLATPGTNVEAAAEDLKSAVKKSEGLLFCHLLKSVATDKELRDRFEAPSEFKDPPDPFDAAARLVDLFKNPRKKPKVVKPAAKAVSRKKPAPKATARTDAKRKSAAKKPVKKVSRKLPATKSNRKR